MKFLIKKSPDGFIKTVNDEISSILNRNFDSLFPEYIFTEDMDKLSIPVEIQEKDSEYKVKAELPGVKKEDLDIDIDKNQIIINAKKEAENEENTKSYRKSEFRYGEFSRAVYFPIDIDVEKTTAKLEHGILKITAPKIQAEKSHNRKLTIEWWVKSIKKEQLQLLFFILNFQVHLYVHADDHHILVKHRVSLINLYNGTAWHAQPFHEDCQHEYA